MFYDETRPYVLHAVKTSVSKKKDLYLCCSYGERMDKFTFCMPNSQYVCCGIYIYTRREVLAIESIRCELLYSIYIYIYIYISVVALIRTRTIPTERPPPVGEVSANFCG